MDIAKVDIAKASRKIESPAAAARRVVLIYAVFAALWIFASDTALEALVRNPAEWARAGMFKGLLFVAATSLLLYGLLIRLLKTTVEARQALAAHYATLFEQARDIVLLIDPAGRIVDANRAAEAAYGYRHAELLGMTVDDLRAPDSVVDMERQWAASANTEGVLFETRHCHRDGRIFPVEVSSRAIDIEGKLYRQSFIRDLTERKRSEVALRDTMAQLAYIAATAPGIVYALRMHPDGSMTFPVGGERLAKDFGIPEARLAENGAPLHALAHPDDVAGLMACTAQSAHSLSPFLHEWRIRHPARGAVWVEGHAMPQREPDGSTLWHGVIIDITSRKGTSEELMKRNTELERFNRVSVNRELDMIALKKRVNALHLELGRAPPFDLSAVIAAESESKR